MAVPMRCSSTMWSRRPTCTGQSRSRTCICMAAITMPSAPSRSTSLSSWRLASCRDSLTSSVQPATSALPDPQRVCRAVFRSSCRDPDREAQHEPCGYPAPHDQLGEILPGQVTGKGHPWPECRARCAYRGADSLELQPPEGKRPPGQPDAHHPVPAKLGALGCHPVDGVAPGLVHGLHERAERPRAAPARTPGSPAGAASRHHLISRPRGSYTRRRTRRCTRTRRTPGRRVRSPRCGRRRTRLRSARTPTCRWTESPAPGPRVLRAVRT